MLTSLGLTIICLAWFYEFYLLSVKKDKNIKIFFVLAYILGVLMLVIDGFMSGLTNIASLNLISLIISVGVLFMLIKNK